MNQERAWMWICHKSSKKKWNDMVYIKVYLDNSAFDEASKIKKKSSKSDKRTTKKKIWTWKKNFMQNKKEKKTKHQSIEIYRSSPVIFVTSWVPDLGLHPSYTNVLYVYIYKWVWIPPQPTRSKLIRNCPMTKPTPRWPGWPHDLLHGPSFENCSPIFGLLENLQCPAFSWENIGIRRGEKKTLPLNWSKPEKITDFFKITRPYKRLAIGNR